MSWVLFGPAVFGMEIGVIGKVTENIKWTEFIEWLKDNGLYNEYESGQTMIKMFQVWLACQIKINEEDEFAHVIKLFKDSFENHERIMYLLGNNVVREIFMSNLSTKEKLWDLHNIRRECDWIEESLLRGLDD